MLGFSRLALALTGALAIVGCGDDGSACPAGHVASEGRCVPIADGAAPADGEIDAGDGPCTPSGDPDLPDTAGIDSDCDGVDGAADSSVFVATSGDDAAGDGTREAPFATVNRGIEAAMAGGHTDVLVGEGTYEERIAIVAGISIHGGYDPAAGWARTFGTTTLRGAGPVVTATDIETETRLTHLSITATRADAGESAVAVHLVRTTGLSIEESELSAGAGGNGVNAAAVTERAPDGMTGTTGGAARSSGDMGSCPGGLTFASVAPSVGQGGGLAGCSCSAMLGTEHGGGDGGRAGSFYAGTSAPPAEAGNTGYGPAIAATYCATGGIGGTTTSRHGNPGAPGSAGAAGGHGAPAALGAFSETGYAPSAGEVGEPGGAGRSGGGGAGGAGCGYNDFCFLSGGAGGGGGSGGCGGAGGDGGGGGGASVALYAWDSNVKLVETELVTAGGGLGGAGAPGQAGGTGGPAGAGGTGFPSVSCVSGPAYTGNGGAGGVGGAGGTGGSGGGGAGGPSIGIVLGGTSTLAPDASGVTFDIGPFGEGGPGGPGAMAGADGVAMEMMTP